MDDRGDGIGDVELVVLTTTDVRALGTGAGTDADTEAGAAVEAATADAPALTPRRPFGEEGFELGDDAPDDGASPRSTATVGGFALEATLTPLELWPEARAASAAD